MGLATPTISCIAAADKRPPGEALVPTYHDQQTVRTSNALPRDITEHPSPTLTNR
jgi:hypothetical protein